jgi:hypothetical protein
MRLSKLVVMAETPERKLVVIFLLVSLSLGFVASQPTESSVVVVSNTEEGLISQPVADKLDAPVLKVGEDYVPRSTSRAINRIGADRVVIVGEENEVSREVENKLRKEASVTRIGEDNSIDTSIAISKRYWSEGSDKVTIVQNDLGRPDITASLQNSIDSGSGPVLFTPSGSLGNTVLSEVERIGAEEATVYADDPKNIKQELQEKGIENVNVVSREDVGSELDQRIDHRVQELLVMPSDSEEGLNSVPSGRHAAGVVVNDRSEINRVVEVVQGSNVEKVVVSGDSPLARATVVAFRTGTDIEIEKKYESSSATVETAFEG